MISEIKKERKFRREVLKTAAIAVLAQALFSVNMVLSAGNDLDRLVAKWALEEKCRPCMTSGNERHE